MVSVLGHFRINTDYRVACFDHTTKIIQYKINQSVLKMVDKTGRFKGGADLFSDFETQGKGYFELILTAYLVP